MEVNNSAGKCMKYKRKFYEAKDYFPLGSCKVETDVQDRSDAGRDSVDTHCSNSSSGSHAQSVSNNSLSQNTGKCTSHNVTVTAETCPPLKKRLLSAALTEPAVPQRPELNHSETFIHTLENNQTTHDICMALLNIAFWRPDTEPRHNAASANTTDKINANELLQVVSERSDLTASAERRVSDVGYTTGSVETSVNNVKHPNTSNGVVSCSSDANVSSSNASATYTTLQPQLKRHEQSPDIIPDGDASYVGHLRAQPSIDDGVSGNKMSYHLDENTHGNSVPIITEPSYMSQKSPTYNLLSVETEQPSPSGVPRCSPDREISTETTVAYNPVSVIHTRAQLSAASALDGYSKDTSSLSTTSCSPPFEAHSPSTSACILPILSPGDSPSVLPPRDSSSPTTSVSSQESSVASPVSYSGFSSLFPKPAKGRGLQEIVKMMAKRHKENYFMEWTAAQVMALPVDERPNVFPVNPQLRKELVSKSVMTENKKLAFSWYSLEPWGEAFRTKLTGGQFKTLSDAKKEASNIWREFCPDYDGRRAVRIRDGEGNIMMKRTRAKSGSEFEYRQSLRKAKVNIFAEQIWAKRSVISEMLTTNDLTGILCDIVTEKPDYKRPVDKVQQLTDAIAYRLRQELHNCNIDYKQ